MVTSRRARPGWLRRRTSARGPPSRPVHLVPRRLRKCHRLTSLRSRPSPFHPAPRTDPNPRSCPICRCDYAGKERPRRRRFSPPPPREGPGRPRPPKWCCEPESACTTGKNEGCHSSRTRPSRLRVPRRPPSARSGSRPRGCGSPRFSDACRCGWRNGRCLDGAAWCGRRPIHASSKTAVGTSLSGSSAASSGSHHSKSHTRSSGRLGSSPANA